MERFQRNALKSSAVQYRVVQCQGSVKDGGGYRVKGDCWIIKYNDSRIEGRGMTCRLQDA